jgi:hypothetical protein
MRTRLLSACLLLAACSASPPPPDATATANAEARTAAADAVGGTGKPVRTGENQELQGAIDSVDYRDKAAGAGDAVEAADKKREEDLKAAGG